MPITDEQIAGAAKAAGFTGLNLVIAVAVALGESSGNPMIIAHESNGSNSYGLWQINSVHSDLLHSHDWRIPQDNARMAFAIFTSAGNKWTDWGAFNNQRYLMFQERARKAVPDATLQDLQSLVPDTTLVNVPGISSAQAAIDLFKFIGDPHNWYRVGLILLGSILLIIALIQMIGSTKTVTGTAKLAAKVI
jgi:hypothetical protein